VSGTVWTESSGNNRVWGVAGWSKRGVRKGDLGGMSGGGGMKRGGGRTGFCRGDEGGLKAEFGGRGLRRMEVVEGPRPVMGNAVVSDWQDLGVTCSHGKETCSR
jgi:hypothetical protein